MAHQIASVSLVNGIENYSLVCSETRTNYFLSKFAIESNVTKDRVRVEHFGIKMVERLSAMRGK